MFYAHIVLAKKGPLARIWLAAHWDKKLTKAHVFETNIEQSVEGIMQPKVKLALRTSGHLLLGVVRIYSRKAKYLLADCNEAFVKIKMAFRPGIVDLPEGHREAAVNAITLPEVFHDFDIALPELNDVDIEAQFSINQSRADEITMREDYGSLSISIHDDGFGDMGGFDAETADLVREGIDAHIDGHLFAEELTEEIERTKEPIPGTSRDVLGDEFVEGFGEEADFQAVGLFEGDIFGEPSAPTQPVELRSDLPAHDDSEDELEHFDNGAPSPMPSEIESRPPTALGVTEGREHLEVPGVDIEEGNARLAPELGEQLVTEEHEEHAATAEKTTIIHDEEESFALAPVDASAFKGVTKAKRKRKLIVDEVKNISGEEMKSQLANTSDIVTTLDLAPPSKRLMYWKETGGVEKLFALPSRNIPARCLFSSYHRNLISRATVVEDFSMLGPADVLAIDQLHEAESPTAPIALGKKGRKRKLPFTEPVTPLPAAEISLASQISEVEQLREAEAQTRISIPLAPEVTESLMPPPATPVSAFDSLRSFPLPDLSGLGPMTPALPSIPGIELNETPIPVLPADQVSSILAQEGGEEDYGQRFDSDLAPDWGEDYFPPSVGAPQPGEEQMEDETDEAFEERVLNKRAAQMFVAVRSRLQKKDTMLLSEMTYRNTRKQAAQKFYSLLVLKKFRALEITQDEPYADILVTKGPMFDNPKL